MTGRCIGPRASAGVTSPHRRAAVFAAHERPRPTYTSWFGFLWAVGRLVSCVRVGGRLSGPRILLTDARPTSMLRRLMKRRTSSGNDSRRSAEAETHPAFGIRNIVALAAAAVSIVVGYLLLDRGSISAAPLLLVLGYVVLIPAGLLMGLRSRGE